MVAAAYVIAMATRAVPLFSGASLLSFILFYGACLAVATVLFARMGMRTYALALVSVDGPLGNSDEVKANRKTVWRDVLGRGR